MDRRYVRVLLAAACALGLLAGAGCSDASDDAGGTVTPALQLYLTCGDPVCSGYGGPFDGVPLCADERMTVGDACTEDGVTCDPVDGCNALVRCSDEDPTQQPGGCPISLAVHKRDVQYLTPAQLEQARAELLAMRLASWEYKGELDDGARHVGFIIDDVGESPAVRPDGAHVDLYGFTSLAVAAIQQQQAELDALRVELAALREACGAQPDPGR